LAVGVLAADVLGVSATSAGALGDPEAASPIVAVDVLADVEALCAMGAEPVAEALVV
jgi:hypothetical protein